MAYVVNPKYDAINRVLNICNEREEEGQTQYRGMSYEQGVKAGIEWIITAGYPCPLDE